jgi:N4-gp56 family major capsid protein
MISYGDISTQTAAYFSKEFLKRGLPFLVLEKFGQGKPLPTNETKTIKFRRYESLDATPKTLVEGVTPASNTLTVTDITATVVQYGDLITISDVVQDTHTDPILQQATEILGEQAALMLENVRFNVLKAGTNVFYANDDGTPLRTEVISPISRDVQRRVTRALKRQFAKQITSVVRSSPNYGTQAVAPSFIALCHPDLESDIRNMAGFVSVENYGSISPYEMEIGKVEDVRYIASTVIAPWADAGANKGAMLSTTGVKADVYPILVIARDAYGIVPLKGKSAITPMVVNPKPSDSDPLAQRGHVGWKAWQTAIILNDAWMARIEVAATA